MTGGIMRHGLLGGVRRVCAGTLCLALTAQLIAIAPATAAPPPREVLSRRTAHSRVFDMGDGTYKFESFSEPIHYEDESTGAFEVIDSDLVRATDPARTGWRNKANAFSVNLPERLGSEWASIESSAATVAFRPARTLALADPASTNSATATPNAVRSEKLSYASAFGPGVTLEYESRADGLKETIILDKYRGKNVFAFDLDTGNLSPRIEDDGGIGLYSAESTAPVLKIAAPYMEDASRDAAGEPQRSDDVSYMLVPQGGMWRLVVAADAKWLCSPERVYPVEIDPTFYTLGFGTVADSFVTNAYPSSNYGTSTELKVGYYPGAGENYSYVMPDLSLLMSLRQQASVQVITANMNLYCSHRYNYASGPIAYGAINGAWSEGGLTWNNQPYATYYSQGTATYRQRTRFDITPLAQTWMDTGVANGIAFWAPVGGQVGHWTKFASRETGANGPVFECAFTTRPKVVCQAGGDTATSGAPRITWTRDDFMYSIAGDPFTSQPQLSANVQIRRLGETAVLHAKSVTGAGTVCVPDVTLAPGRYFARVQVVTDVTGTGRTSTSDWSAWAPFTVAPLSSGSDGAGIEGYRASDTAGGATVDLATGRLLLSRTDMAYQGLGGVLGAGFVYDSSVTTDTAGVGTGWRVGVPALGFDDQKAPNPGFEQGSGTACPSDWIPSDPAYVSRSATYRNGSYSLKLSRPAGSYGAAVAYSSSTPAEDLAVVPGQRLDATAWARTEGFARYTAAGGVFAQIAYFDEYGTLLSAPCSSVLYEATTPVGVGWRKVALASVAPAGAAKARLILAMTNSCGSVYFDDVYFASGQMAFTDSDGTSRDLAQAGGGTYERDPLSGTLALARRNLARGIVPTLAGTGGSTGASTDGNYAMTTGSGFDYVFNGTDVSLTYDLGEARVLSEARLLLWDGGEVGEASPREHSYKLQYASAAAGPYADIADVGIVTGARSWQTHYFAPVSARYFRIVAVGSTSGAFCLCELELPQTTISESPVAFDAGRRVTGIADTSGNLIRYTYQTDGDLLSCSDSQGRMAGLVWEGEELASLDFTGVGSASGTAVPEAGIVAYERAGAELRVKRKRADGTYVTLATYTYTSGRITGVTDADGISAEIAYEGGRVHSITRSSEATPTVTHYEYGVADQVTITTSGGEDSVSRRVEFDPDLGCQVTAVTADPGGEALTTTFSYDSYGHLASVTSGSASDGTLRTDTYTSDAHGNVIESIANSAGTGDLKLTTSATYTNDRVASTTDAKGNVSNRMYDAKWRPISSTVAVTNATDSGTSITEEYYDTYGNVLSGEIPGSTVANLLKNGSFETNVLLGGTGWTLYGDVRCVGAPSGQPNLGYLMVKGGDGTPWIESDPVSVIPGEAYIASAWSTSGGRIGLSEYGAAGQWLRRITLASPPPGDGLTLLPVSALYVPPAGVASVRFEIGLEGGAVFDNARLERANAAGATSFIDNDSVERLGANGVPEAWNRYYGADDVADSVVVGTERALRLLGGSGATGTPWWESAPVPVTAGQDKRFSVSVASDGLTPATGAWTGVQVVFFTDYGCNWDTAVRVNLTGAKPISGTTSWATYSSVIKVPANMHWVKVCPQIGLASGALYADHMTMEQVTAREQYGYDGSHTYRTSTTQLSGAKTGASFDSRGRATQVTHTNPGASTASVETTRSFDGLDRLTGATTAPASNLGITAAFTYTPAGRLASVTDPLARVTSIEYLEGRIASVTSPSGRTTAMTYDGLGRLAATTAPYRETETPRTLLEYAYDSVGRLASTTFYAPDGSVAATQSVTLDDLSRPVAVTWSGPEAQGSVATTYDALGRTAAVSSTGPAGTATLTSTYDKASLPLTTSFTAFGLPQVTTTNTFAKTGQWQTTSTAGSQQWSFTFGADSTFRRAASALSSRALLYNTALQLERVRLGSGTFSADESITRDGYGRIASDTIDASASALDSTQSFSYDPAGRLVSWSLNGTPTTYIHDAAGNLTAIDRPGSGYDVTMTYGTDNEIESATTGSVETTFAHDDFGRRTSASSPAGDVSYTWDSLGKLTRIASEDATSTYLYGPSGMRERVVTESAEGTTTTDSLWAGGLLLAEHDSGGTLYRYLYGPDRLPLELIVTPPGGTPVSYAFQCDASGSVIGLTDSAGTLVATYSYDPWGALLTQGGTNPVLAERNPLRYRAYYYDTATSLYYLPARYYDPGTMRFLSPDPAAPSAGDPLSLNRYAYCVGDPVNASDPSGAITDWDADGQVDGHDSSQHAARHSGNGKLRRLFGARAERRYYQSMLSSNGVSSARALVASSLLVAAVVSEAGAWADSKGFSEYYIDMSVTGSHWGAGGTVGLMGGRVLNYRGGEVTDAHTYGGVTIGMPGDSWSIMVGKGRVEPARRYIEFAVGARVAGAWGFRSDNDRSAPWQLGAMADHAAANDYLQFGVCQASPSAAVSWFYVLP
ncbi:MAG: DNRLRE domain-containing protein [Actinobacteria bacterium]|nr:DNRLRE domain-containing protein [Actinomycetota bacterium]